jgi:hypothetical protein
LSTVALGIAIFFFAVQEIVVGSNMDKIYIVMDYVEHDLKSLMEIMKEPFSIGQLLIDCFADFQGKKCI